MTKPLSELVASALRKRGLATISELLSDVAPFIDAAHAIAKGKARQRSECKRLGQSPRRLPRERMENRGRRALISDALYILNRKGSIERLSDGRWRWKATSLVMKDDAC